MTPVCCRDHTMPITAATSLCSSCCSWACSVNTIHTQLSITFFSHTFLITQAFRDTNQHYDVPAMASAQQYLTYTNIHASSLKQRAIHGGAGGTLGLLLITLHTRQFTVLQAPQWWLPPTQALQVSPPPQFWQHTLQSVCPPHIICPSMN